MDGRGEAASLFCAGVRAFKVNGYYSQPCKKRSSVNSNTLRDAQIWSILPHIALAASGFSCFRHENASRYSGLCTVTIYVSARYAGSILWLTLETEESILLSSG